MEHSRSVFGGITTILMATAGLMPKEKYDFRPTDEVRSFGEILVHVADSQYAFCSLVRDEDVERPDADKIASSKTAVVEALEQAFAFCAAAYDGLTPESALERVSFQGKPRPRLGVLNVNQVHTIEHYGNLVTYLRMNDIVPPTSNPELMKRLQE